MNKLNKIIVGMSCIAMLGACAKTVTAEEAANVADGLKFSDVKATSGTSVYKVEKVETTGNDAATITKALGLEEGKTETKDLNVGLEFYFVSGAAIRALGDTNTTYKVDGTAISYENSATSELKVLTINLITVTVTKNAYRSDGMLSKSEISTDYTLNESKVSAKVSYTFTWNA